MDLNNIKIIRDLFNTSRPKIISELGFHKHCHTVLKTDICGSYNYKTCALKTISLKVFRLFNQKSKRWPPVLNDPYMLSSIQNLISAASATRTMTLTSTTTSTSTTTTSATSTASITTVFSSIGCRVFPSVRENCRKIMMT